MKQHDWIGEIEAQVAVNAERWGAAHDDTHSDAALAEAAATYAHPTKVMTCICGAIPKDGLTIEQRQRQLVHSGALVVAELERLDRANGRTAGSTSTTGATPPSKGDVAGGCGAFAASCANDLGCAVVVVVVGTQEDANGVAERYNACFAGCAGGNPSAVPGVVAALRAAVDGVEVGCEPGWVFGARAALGQWEEE